MNRWLVLTLLLVIFLVGDLIGGKLANSFDWSNWGELAFEFFAFAAAAALIFWRWLPPRD